MFSIVSSYPELFSMKSSFSNMQIRHLMTSYIQPILNAFSSHLCRFILIFANGASYAESRKHLDMLAQVCGLEKKFFEKKVAKLLKSSGWGP